MKQADALMVNGPPDLGRRMQRPQHQGGSVSEGVAQGKRPELTGGGLVRSAGGWQKLAANRKFGDYRKGDERILGDSFCRLQVG